jgi:hypothetical protein
MILTVAVLLAIAMRDHNLLDREPQRSVQINPEAFLRWIDRENPKC